MTIWVDADACPVPIREMLVRAAERTGVEMVFVANHVVPVPKRANIRSQQVPKGFDVADNAIVTSVQAHDLVVTQDIPLAAEVLAKGAQAIGPRGQVHTADNIRGRLTVRDFMETLRASGEHTAGPPPLNARDKQLFASALDKYLLYWQRFRPSA